MSPNPADDLLDAHEAVSLTARRTYDAIRCIRRGVHVARCVRQLTALKDSLLRAEELLPFYSPLDLELNQAAGRRGPVKHGGAFHSSMHRAVIWFAHEVLCFASDADASIADGLAAEPPDEQKLSAAYWPAVRRRFRERVAEPDHHLVAAALSQEYSSVALVRQAPRLDAGDGRVKSPERKSPCPRWDPKTEARNRWLYEQFRERKLTVASIRRRVNAMAPEKGWGRIETDQGVRSCVDAYARHIGADLPRRRLRDTEANESTS
jgi:hypothetical protein